MKRAKSRIAVGFMAILVLTTGIVGAGQIPAFSSPVGVGADQMASTTVIAEASQGDLGLAVFSILLGGGMFYLFRPIRRVSLQLRD